MTHFSCGDQALASRSVHLQFNLDTMASRLNWSRIWPKASQVISEIKLYGCNITGVLDQCQDYRATVLSLSHSSCSNYWRWGWLSYRTVHAAFEGYKTDYRSIHMSCGFTDVIKTIYVLMKNCGREYPHFQRLLCNLRFLTWRVFLEKSHVNQNEIGRKSKLRSGDSAFVLSLKRPWDES
jgi:hypothetical protein